MKEDNYIHCFQRYFQIRDSAAIIEYLVWLEEQIAGGKEITEVHLLNFSLTNIT